MNLFQDEIFSLIQKEKARQENQVMLIASENYTSKHVLEAQGSILTNKYAEGYPKKRYYEGCDIVDEIEFLSIERVKSLFNAKYANVQPHSGSQANQAVFLALLNPGDRILSMSLNSGGHLTHGSKVNLSGKWFEVKHYDVGVDGFLDYDHILEIAKEFKPKLIICGYSAYPRIIDFKKFRHIANAVGSFLLADIAHIAGLIAAKNNIVTQNNLNSTTQSDSKDSSTTQSGDNKDISTTQSDSKDNSTTQSEDYKSSLKTLMDQENTMEYADEDYKSSLKTLMDQENPMEYADVVTSTTHKSLRGPRGGIILTNHEDIAKKIDSAIFPGIQGGPLMHVIAAKGISFKEASTAEYTAYILNVIRNTKIMAEELKKRGFEIVSGGTDNHLFLVNLINKNISGKDMARRLAKIGIICNKNTVPGEKLSPFVTSGIRIGTLATTTRGFGPNEYKYLAEIISKVAEDESQKYLNEIESLCRRFPIYN